MTDLPAARTAPDPDRLSCWCGGWGYFHNTAKEPPEFTLCGNCQAAAEKQSTQSHGHTELVSRLRELLAKGVIPSDSGWYISGYRGDGLAVISDGLSNGIFPIKAEAHQAELIVEAINALPTLLDALSRSNQEASHD